MREKDIQTVFGKINQRHGVFELKLSKGISIRFDSVKEHQREALLKASGDEGLYHKISDSFIGTRNGLRFPSPKPFDCVFLKNTPAFVVVCFYVPYKRKTFYYVPIERWWNAEMSSDKKSIREADLEPYAIEILEV